MIATIAAATIVLASFEPRTDTTLTVPATGVRLVIENHAGEVVIGTWTRNAVRIEADHSSRSTVEVERDGSTVMVRPRGRWGAPSAVDFRITAPAAVSVEIAGVYTDVTVTGVKGDIAIETVKGDVNVTGGTGHIALESVEGDVVLEGGRGRAVLSSVNAGVRVKGHDGDLAAETVNGEIVLEDVRGASVEASTVNGDVFYDGEIRSGGRYSFGTHNGDITVVLPAQPNVTVSVATFSGEFYTDIPIKMQSSHRNKRMRFTIGTGAAELDLESFQGAIRIDQKGTEDVDRAREKAKDKSKDKDGKHGDGE